MGKCVSKQPTSAISIASLDEDDLKEICSPNEQNFSFVQNLPTPKIASLNIENGNKSSENEGNREKSESGADEWLTSGTVFNKAIGNVNHEGQSESKKHSKRSGLETKGTAMSFGFRKKIHNTQKKKNSSLDDQGKFLINADYHQEKQQHESSPLSDEDLLSSDKNGNSGAESSSSDKNNTTHNVSSVKRENGLFQKGVNRFGFRSTNIVRPASAGITPKLTEIEENVKNNNPLNQRRSKSALGPRTTTDINQYRQNDYQSNRNNNNLAPKINTTTSTGNRNNNDNNNGSSIGTTHQPRSHERRVTWDAPSPKSSRLQQQQQQQQQQQYQNILTTATSQHNSHQHQSHFQIINTGMHTNVIVKPTPQPAVSVSKFTLHTASLPKPQYPVPISLSSTPSTMVNSPCIRSNNTRDAPKATTMGINSSPVSVALVDTKNAKQVANSTRKGVGGGTGGFYLPREVSADSGISGMDNIISDSSGTVSCTSQRFSRSRPRNLEMVFSGRHKFEVRDVLNSTCNSSIVETLALPKLPSAFSSDAQTVPLSGLVRSNTVLNQESLQAAASNRNDRSDNTDNTGNSGKYMPRRIPYISGAESTDEEKLFRDTSTSEKEMKTSVKCYTAVSSKNSSPGSSRASWCNAGESLAFKDCSSLSMSSSDESKDHQNEKTGHILEEDLSSITINEKPSLLSSFTDSAPKYLEKRKTLHVITGECSSKIANNAEIVKSNEKPIGNLSKLTESKFAEMVATVSDVLLDDETSPTDSLVSSTESEEAMVKKSKKKACEGLSEKDIDEISPELDASSPLSPGTPTHASNSLSLSDVGRDFLIDDEIADQPELLFSNKSNLKGHNAFIDDSNEDAGGKNGREMEENSLISMNKEDTSSKLILSLTDTPTLIDNTVSNISESINIGTPSTQNMSNVGSKSKNKSAAVAAATAAIDQILRTPLSIRRSTKINRAESLDTLSPCESIASDDLMIDFESHSSMDSIDRMSHSMRNQCENALQAIDQTELLSELEIKGSEMIKEWNNILRAHRTGKDNIISQLPARATRLLNRARVQQATAGNNVAGSDSSPKSGDSLPRKYSRTSSLRHTNSNREITSSSDDLFLHDKSFRNSMIQDVLYFKKQLLKLRRILQETETLNPFELGNGQFFSSCGIDSGSNSDDKDLGSFTSSTTDDPLQELADLRRQVVYLQGQVEDRDRTIKLQRSAIEKLEDENQRIRTLSISTSSVTEKEWINTATQTDRTRPLSIGQEGLARSKQDGEMNYTAYHPTTGESKPTKSTKVQQSLTNQHQPSQLIEQHHSTIPIPVTTSRRHTVISTTFSNLNHLPPTPSRRSSIGWDKMVYKPVKTTLIGEPMSMQQKQKSSQQRTSNANDKLTICKNDVNYNKDTVENSDKSNISLIPTNNGKHFKFENKKFSDEDKLTQAKLSSSLPPSTAFNARLPAKEVLNKTEVREQRLLHNTSNDNNNYIEKESGNKSQKYSSSNASSPNTNKADGKFLNVNNSLKYIEKEKEIEGDKKNDNRHQQQINNSNNNDRNLTYSSHQQQQHHQPHTVTIV